MTGQPHQRTIDYDSLADRYAIHRVIHPGVLRALLETGDIGRSSGVLELGCGTGNYIIALTEATGCTALGLDPSRQMLSEASARSSDVVFQQATAEQMAVPGESFQLVFSVDVLHHLRSTQAYFKEAHRVLESGGKLCTVTDSEWVIRHREPLAIYFPETVQVDLDRYPSVAEVRETMAGSGFKDLSEELVEFRYELTDARPYREKVFSSLQLISEAAFRRGIQRLERDVSSGPISCVSRYLLIWGAKDPLG
jgi:ubiquinone/menaquinone biosynthesis C-methylase UbiE